jgi:hypothetical protein
VSYQGGGRLVLGIDPGDLRKGDARVAYRGRGAPCPCCKRPGGTPFIAHAKLPRGIVRDMEAAAFEADLQQLTGLVAVGTVAYWPRKWGPNGRAPGRPCGDVDAPVSNLLDVLAPLLYRDDAQVGLLVAANAYDKARPRIEVTARPLDPLLLSALTAGLGLPFDSARLTLGQQGSLL